MALKINEKQAGVTLGLLFAVLYAAWAVIVGMGLGQVLINWVQGIKFVSFSMLVGTVNWWTAIIGILAAFVCGAIIGWLFAKIWNWLPKQKWYKQL